MKKLILLTAFLLILPVFNLSQVFAQSMEPEIIPPKIDMEPGMMSPRFGRGPGIMPPRIGMGPGMMPPRIGMERGMMPPRFGRGPGIMPPRIGMGPGIMPPRFGMGPGMMGPQYRSRDQKPKYHKPPKPLDEEKAKELLDKYLKSTRNPNLKLGKIEDKDKSFEAEIITTDGCLVDKILVNKRTRRIRSGY